MTQNDKPSTSYNHKITVPGGLPIGVSQSGSLAGGWMEFGKGEFLAVISNNQGGDVHNYAAYCDGCTNQYGAHRLSIGVQDDKSIRVQIVTFDEVGRHAVNTLTLDELNDAINLYRQAVPAYA